MDKKRFIADVAVEEDMFKVMTTQGVVMQVEAYGGKNRYKGSKGFYGVKKSDLSEESKEFMDQHLSDGTISLIPKKMEKKIRSIETKARNKIRDCSIGYNKTYVPIALYPEVVEHFEECQEEFYTIKKIIVDGFDSSVMTFKNQARATVSHLDKNDAERELNALFAKIPTKEKFADGMSFNLRISTFLTAENLDLLPEEIREKIEKSKDESSDNVVREGIINILSDTFTSLSSVVNSGKRNAGKPASKSVAGLKNQAKRIGQKNIFGNSKVTTIKTEVEEMLSFSGEELVEYGERILADVYDYAKELGIDHEIDMTVCPFTEKELDELYEMYNM